MATYLLQNWAQLLVTLIVGGLLGVFLMALLVAAAEEEVRADMDDRPVRQTDDEDYTLAERADVADELLKLRGHGDCTVRVPGDTMECAGDERKEGAA